MPVVIDATAGSVSANSFLTLADAQTYMDARLNGATWDAASIDTQNRALVEATREISNLAYIGYRASDTQALAWPRQFAENPDVAWPGIIWFATDAIPDRVKYATAELAFQFVNLGTTDAAALDPNAQVIRKTVDVLTTEYAPGFQRPQGLGRWPRVLNFLTPLLVATSASAEVIRG